MVDFDFENELIGSIYDCALNPSSWTAGHSAGIVLLDYSGVNDRLVRDWGPTKVWGDQWHCLVIACRKFAGNRFLALLNGRSGPSWRRGAEARIGVAHQSWRRCG